ncbi:MAG: hypothetical protein PWR30_123 [Candidatus Woesearchaeota archaeon]|nr:hypothetical protein [Candidatus Woesearchaeota archaeon]
MDWKECNGKSFVKDIKKDKHRIKSIQDVAELKIESAEFLPEEHYISKISLLYDSLRELLEVIALENGYKIYNHECYTAFLKEILGLSVQADSFDKIRKIRNGINYYGRKLSIEEARKVIEDIHSLIKEFQSKTQSSK